MVPWKTCMQPEPGIKLTTSFTKNSTPTAQKAPRSSGVTGSSWLLGSSIYLDVVVKRTVIHNSPYAGFPTDSRFLLIRFSTHWILAADSLSCMGCISGASADQPRNRQPHAFSCGCRNRYVSRAGICGEPTFTEKPWQVLLAT